jgi:hypothetical protein
VASIISNLLAVFKTDVSELPPAVRFVPAPYLFVHAEPLPDGMQPSELDGFASVTLEGLAPLPLEQLAWGYLTNEKGRSVLLFGAFQERLNLAQLAPEESFFQVLPSFFAAAPASGGAQWVFIWEAGHVSAVHYGAGESVPSRVEVERLKEDTLAEAFAGREALLKRLGAHARQEAAPGLLAQPESVRGSRERLTFSFAHYDSAEATSTRVPGHVPGGIPERWSADLRGNIFRAAEQHRRKATATAGLVLIGAAAFALFCIMAQGYVVYGHIWVKKTQTEITFQAPDVDLVNQRVKLLAQISQFVDHELHPFEMIGTINPLRPNTDKAKSIFYVKTRAYENNKLSIDCVGTDSQTVDDFVQALSNFPQVALDSEHLNVQSNPLAVPPTYKFTLNLTFNTVPANEEMPPEAPVPVAPDQQDSEPALAAADQQDYNNPNAGQVMAQPDGQNPGQDATPFTDNTPAAGVPQSGPTIIVAPTAPVPDPVPVPVPAPAPAPAPDATPAQ